MIGASKYITTIEKAVRCAGSELNALRSKTACVLASKGKDIKLEADKRSEAIILDILRQSTSFSVLSEEAGWIGNPSDLYWVVDPLDGSYNFFREVPLCSTSVALCRGNEVVAGGIYNFIDDELFLGGNDCKATMNGAPISVSNTDSIETSALATGLPVKMDYSEQGMCEFAKILAPWKKVRMFGSANYSLTNIACGKLDCYIERGIFWWDVAAGLAIVKAAGGKFLLNNTAEVHQVNVVATNSVLDPVQFITSKTERIHD